MSHDGRSITLAAWATRIAHIAYVIEQRRIRKARDAEQAHAPCRCAEKVSSKSNSGFDREQADRLVVGLHRTVQEGFACFALLDMNCLLTISGLQAILKTPSEVLKC